MDAKKLINQLEKVFFKGDAPNRFTIHDDSCWECELSNKSFKKLAKSLQGGKVINSHPGPDSLFSLNGNGFKFLFPYLAKFVLSESDPESFELMTDLVEGYIPQQLENYKSVFSKPQVCYLKDFGLYELNKNHSHFINFGFEEKEIENLSELYNKIQC